MKIELSPGDVQELSADGRGRVYLGPEHANKTVEVAVLNAED